MQTEKLLFQPFFYLQGNINDDLKFTKKEDNDNIMLANWQN